MTEKPSEVLRLPWYWAWDQHTQTWRKARIYF
jgi:hypothetical protein